MRRVSVSMGLAVLLVVAAAAGVTAEPYGPSARVDIGFFYDELAADGEWLHHTDYGWVWSPYVESDDWRPYTLGQWVWTDEYGWLWSSDEPFGWAVYHYGRWLDDEEYGWVWVPGLEWGPAWVAWREGDGYIGWAPLPPRAGWDIQVGFRVDVALFDDYVPERHYCFVRDRLFVERTVFNHLLPASRTRSCYRATRNCTDYRPHRGRIVNRSVDVERVRRVIGRAVPRVRPVDVRSAREMRRRGAGSGEVAVFRPRIDARTDRRPPSRRSGEGRAMHTRRPYGYDAGVVERREAETRDAERAQRERVERQRERESAEREPAAGERRQAAERQQQQERQRAEETHAVRRREAGTAAGVREEEIRALERQQAERRHHQEREAAAAEQARREEEGRATAARQAEAEERARAHREERASRESESRVSAQPRREERGPSDSDRSSGSSSRSSSSSSSSSSTSSHTSSSSDSSKEKEKEKEKDKEREFAVRRRNSAAGGQ